METPQPHHELTNSIDSGESYTHISAIDHKIYLILITEASE